MIPSSVTQVRAQFNKFENTFFRVCLLTFLISSLIEPSNREYSVGWSCRLYFEGIPTKKNPKAINLGSVGATQCQIPN